MCASLSVSVCVCVCVRVCVCVGELTDWDLSVVVMRELWVQQKYAANKACSAPLGH